MLGLKYAKKNTATFAHLILYSRQKKTVLRNHIMNVRHQKSSKRILKDGILPEIVFHPIWPL